MTRIKKIENVSYITNIYRTFQLSFIFIVTTEVPPSVRQAFIALFVYLATACAFQCLETNPNKNKKVEATEDYYTF